MTQKAEAIIEMKSISKSYGAVKALEDVCLKIYPAEVLALMGENGAGKSTLMNILSAASQADAGQILIDSVAVSMKSPLQAQQLGIAKIHQELQIVPELNVMENIFLGRWKKSSMARVDFKTMREKSEEYLAQLDCNIDPQRKLKDLRIGEKQLVEIAKALSLNCRLIIMDEPTSALSETEARQLFKVIDKLRAEGKSIIYITHRMEEVFKIADRIAVLRDGKNIGDGLAKDTSSADIISMMVGRKLENQYPHREVELGECFFNVKHLSYTPNKASFKRPLNDISFTLRTGEVLGIAGLAGAGRSELLESLVGNFGKEAKVELSINGIKHKIEKPSEALQAGLVLATEDRKGTGLVLGRSIGENLSLPLLKVFSDFAVMNKKKEQGTWREFMEKLRIKAPSFQSKVADLSGGNQQKVVLARCLMTKPYVLLLDEPTRGIDVGAKEEIYQIINKLAEQGLGIIVVSSELPELIGISDRIIVLCEGHLTGEFQTAEVTQESIMKSMTAAPVII